MFRHESCEKHFVCLIMRVLVLVTVGCGHARVEAPTSTRATSSETVASASGAGATPSVSGPAADTGTPPTPRTPVAGCEGLEAPGTWVDITPDEVDLKGYGVHTLRVSAHDPRTLYLGTEGSGIYRSDQCGATGSWVKVNTGRLGAEIGRGSASIVLDPVEPGVLYANSLYGLNGFFKSTNGGVDFDSILPRSISDYAPYGGFIGSFVMDPGDHLHLLVSWHYDCAAPYNTICYAETRDGGASWEMRNGPADWRGGEGSAIQFITSDIWILGATSGVAISQNRGQTWEESAGLAIAHGAGPFYRSPSGRFFYGTPNGVVTSDDGLTWRPLKGSGSLIGGIAGDGDNIWASTAFPYNPSERPQVPYQTYFVAKENALDGWQRWDSPPLLTSGGGMVFDPHHRILYSTNLWAGAWRVVIE
jgi:hypothetical protein